MPFGQMSRRAKFAAKVFILIEMRLKDHLHERNVERLRPKNIAKEVYDFS
jgi:hypothetical protein